ncbi:MAG: S1 family peptidase [Calothrix sp. SM1_5_4]|nr:S1 family peptidase [Calothrix sp. SM1_5_4]
MLYFVRDMAANRVSIQRCTGSLVAANLVLSNGHCDFTHVRGYFAIPWRGGTLSRRIKSVVFKRHEPDRAPPDRARAAPDVALFELEAPSRKFSR